MSEDAAPPMKLTSFFGPACLLLAACGDLPAGGDQEPIDLALSDALRLDDPLLRAERITSRLRHLDAASADAALGVLERHLALATPEDAAWFAIAAARVDPAKTLDRVLRWPWLLRERGAAEAVAEWAKRDPAAAAAGIRGRPDLDLRPALVHGWAQVDPEAALRFVDGQPPGSSRTQQVRAFAEVARRSQLDTGMRWLEALLAQTDLSAPVRRELAVAAVGAAAAIDPLEAAAWLSPRVGAPETAGAIAALAAEWGALDPPGAAAWLISLTAGAERDRALRELVQTWLARDREEAERWLSASAPAAALLSRNARERGELRAGRPADGSAR